MRLGELRRLLHQTLENFPRLVEMVFVDDGSRDRTYRLLEEIAAVDSRVLLIKLRRNFGQTSALAAGFDQECAGAAGGIKNLQRQHGLR